MTHLASFGLFRRFVTTSAGCTTPTRPSLPYTTSNKSLRLVGRFPRHPSALHPASIWHPPPPTSPRNLLVASSASICPTPGLHLASTTTNESRCPVGGFPGLHLPYPPTNESLRLVGQFPWPPFALHPASIWPPPPPTSPRDSLVASSASIYPTPGLPLPPTTTNKS